MAQADYIISNQTFPNTRADINNHLSAIATNNSGTSAPTTQYAGQFWIDTTTTTWTLYIHDGTDDIQFATIDTSANTVNFTDSALDVVTDTTPQLGGDLDTNGNNINFGDNDKAQFGASQDLQIYHDGTNSYVDDAGTGVLFLRGNTGVRIDKYTGETMANFIADGAVNLYHNDVKKFETTSTGVTITGGLTLADSHFIGDDTFDNLEIKSSSGEGIKLTTQSLSDIVFQTNNNERMRIDSSGNVIIGSGGLDVSGIGGTYTALNMRAGSGYSTIYGQTTATTTNKTALSLTGATSGASAGGAAELLGVIQIACESDSSTNATGYINFYTGSGGGVSEKMRITSSGELLLGGTNSDYVDTGGIQPNGSGTQRMYGLRHTSTTSGIDLCNWNSGIAGGGLSGTGNFLQLVDGGNTRFKFKGDGNATCDGSFSGGGADYAEYFEWTDGNSNNEDRVGLSVVLDNGKIREATESDTNIIGVVSANPTVIGDEQPHHWQDKFVTDDFGRVQYETLTTWKWEIEDENGKTTDGYIEGRTDKDIPENATNVESFEHPYEMINPNYDETLEYIPRSQRQEWSCVGLMGKLRIKKGQQTNSNWIKIRDISDTVEEWLIK